MNRRVDLPREGYDNGERTRASLSVEIADAFDEIVASDMLPDEFEPEVEPGITPEPQPIPGPRRVAKSQSTRESRRAPESRSSPGPLSLTPGVRIGQYEIIRELGRGGMGAVYAARDTKLGRKVAIKFLTGDLRPDVTARFIIEAQATARCSHENIVVIYEVGEHAGNPFMVLEHLQGVPLKQMLQDGRKLPPAEAVELMVPVVRALTVAHAHDIVHRDLKPDNIFVTDSGTVKVL